MLFELSVIPLGGDKHLSDELAPVLSLIDRSGMPYSWARAAPASRAAGTRRWS